MFNIGEYHKSKSVLFLVAVQMSLHPCCTLSKCTVNHRQCIFGAFHAKKKCDTPVGGLILNENLGSISKFGGNKYFIANDWWLGGWEKNQDVYILGSRKEKLPIEQLAD